MSYSRHFSKVGGRLVVVGWTRLSVGIIVNRMRKLQLTLKSRTWSKDHSIQWISAKLGSENGLYSYDASRREAHESGFAGSRIHAAVGCGLVMAGINKYMCFCSSESPSRLPRSSLGTNRISLLWRMYLVHLNYKCLCKPIKIKLMLSFSTKVIIYCKVLATKYRPQDLRAIWKHHYTKSSQLEHIEISVHANFHGTSYLTFTIIIRDWIRKTTAHAL